MENISYRYLKYKNLKEQQMICCVCLFKQNPYGCEFCQQESKGKKGPEVLFLIKDLPTKERSNQAIIKCYC